MLTHQTATVWLKTLGSQRREELPEQVRKESPTSRDSGTARVTMSGQESHNQEL